MTTAEAPARDQGQGGIHLDPLTTFNEFLQLAEVRSRAAAGAAQMVEDYLWTRVRVLATSEAKLKSANLTLSEQLAQIAGADAAQIDAKE